MNRQSQAIAPSPLSSPSEVLADHRPPASDFPPWLVESLELGCCRLLAERVNTHRALILASGRRDIHGSSTWSDAEAYLAARAGCLHPRVTRVQDHIELQIPELISATAYQVSPFLWELALTIQIPGSDTNYTDSVEVQFAPATAIPLAPIRLDLDRSRAPQVFRPRSTIPRADKFPSRNSGQTQESFQPGSFAVDR